MEIEDIRNQCKKQLAIMDGASIGLVIKAKFPKSGRYKLFGVEGQVVEEKTRNSIYVLFPAREMLDKLNILFPDPV